jgi:hypothetical protein
VFVVCKNHIRPNENAIFNGRPVVDTHTVLHRDLIADLNIVLNEYVGTDVAGITDHGLFEYHDELPYAVAHSNVFRLHIGQGMNGILHSMIVFIKYRFLNIRAASRDRLFLSVSMNCISQVSMPSHTMTTDPKFLPSLGNKEEAKEQCG